MPSPIFIAASSLSPVSRSSLRNCSTVTGSFPRSAPLQTRRGTTGAGVTWIGCRYPGRAWGGRYVFGSFCSSSRIRVFAAVFCAICCASSSWASHSHPGAPVGRVERPRAPASIRGLSASRVPFLQDPCGARLSALLTSGRLLLDDTLRLSVGDPLAGLLEHYPSQVAGQGHEVRLRRERLQPAHVRVLLRERRGDRGHEQQMPSRRCPSAAARDGDDRQDDHE